MTTDTPPTGPAIATELVDYQSDSIVSRQILKTPGGGLTAFAFDAGQALSEHSSPQEALIQVIEGEAEISVGGQPHLLTAGQMIRLPAELPHAVTAHARFKMLLTMLRS